MRASLIWRGTIILSCVARNESSLVPFARTGVGPLETIVHTGAPVPGQDLPDGNAACNTVFNPGSGAYGVPVDINLDGIVDGLDLAFLASRYGTTIP